MKGFVKGLTLEKIFAMFNENGDNRISADELTRAR